ncbi:MAG: FapA family protein [Candidatus Brocadiaceae bacterium]|nr:FapA family protein [Candidatus Brocadiaceae bacterium]
MAESADKTKFFAIKVSDDHMKVYLTVKPFAQKDIDINLNDVLQTLQSRSISFGIKEDVIKTTLDEVKQENISVENVLIAEGDHAINGEDGRLEFLFNVDKKIKPQEGAHGKVDFHELSMVENVEKEQPLVKLIDSTPGTPGKNVYGKMVNPVHGKPCVLPIGENTKVSNKDTKLLVSCIDGIVKYVGGVVSVKSCYAVEKDVDFSTGNITSKGTVVVKGNVRSGFILDAGGDVEVWGTVEDSMIKSKGNVLVKGGFIGSGKGKIEADGDVTIYFARNQTIVATNVIILREAVDCTIYAKNTVKAHGDKISIGGGITTAGAMIEVESLGSKNEVHTDVEAGIDYTAHQSQMSTRKEISGLKAVLKTVDKELNTLHAIKKAKGELPAQYTNTFDHLLSRREELVKKLKDFASVEILPVNEGAKVVVNKVVHPGVEITIGEPTMTILEECKKATFYLSGDEIKIKT